ncbi:MAG: GYD domain-containing protein [Bacteroidota bacterium]
MQTFILLTKLSPDLASRMNNREQIGKSWLMKVKDKCPDVKFISHFAILGQYDFLDIYEAPDIETATKVSMISRQHGASHAESLPAIEYKKYVDLVSDL